MARKRAREAPNVDVELVEIYEDLANENEAIRLKAARALLTKLSFQQAPKTLDIEKALNRLIKGLSSGRKSARIGFSIALTEVLTQLFGVNGGSASELDLSIEKVLEILQKQTHPTSNLPGQEQRDLHFGRLFGLEAVIKSEILFQRDRPSALWNQVLDLIFELAKKKPWLCEECGWILFEAVSRILVEPGNERYIQALVDRLYAHELTKTSEGVAIWLSVKAHAPNVSFPKDVWQNDDPLDRKERRSLAQVLKGCSISTGKKNQDGTAVAQNGIWNPRLHFIWDVLLATFVEKETPGNKRAMETNSINFETFWRESVDSTLFSVSASSERKYLGFRLFSKVAVEAPQYLLEDVFCKNLKRCLVNQLASSDRYLHRAALDSLKSIHARLEVEPDLAYTIVARLSNVESGSNFDQATKTKTVERLMLQASNESLVKIVRLYRHLMIMPMIEEPKTAEVQRRLLADQLVAVFRTRKVKDSHGSQRGSDTWVRDMLYLFVELSYSTPTEHDSKFHLKPNLSSASQSMYRSRLSTCLGHILSTKAHLQADYAYDVVCNVRQREEKHVKGNLTFDAHGDARKMVQRAWKTLDQIHADEASHKAQNNVSSYRAMKLLFSLTILEVYNGTADAVSLLDELKVCYDELIKPRKDGAVQSGEASELLVEILLSFISKPSVLFRKLAQQVFAAFVSAINEGGLQSMITVVLSNENTKGQQAMFDQDVEDVRSNDDDDSSNGDSGLSDVEVIDETDVTSSDAASKEGQDDGGSRPSEPADEDSDSAGNNEHDDELAEFDAKLAQALGTTRVDGNMPDASDQTSDTDMDDDQMMAIEPHLIKVFKEMKETTSKKKEKKDAKETVVNFKLRVLDLLLIYIKKRHQELATLNIITPLLKAVSSTKSSQVSQRICQILVEYSKACKGREIPFSDEAESTSFLWGLLSDFYQEALKAGSNDYANACGSAIILLCRVLYRADKNNFARIGVIHMETLAKPILDGIGRFRGSFLTDWNNWYISLVSNIKNGSSVKKETGETGHTSS